MTINNSNNPTGNEPANDETYMRRAIELAALGRFTTSPNPNVGCVIVKEGKIIGEGYHHHAGGPHAEVNALNMAGENVMDIESAILIEKADSLLTQWDATQATLTALGCRQIQRVTL
ncbi:hypothetical protein ACEE86_12035 [Proteus mirabilis]